MYKIFLALILTTLLSAEMIDGIAVIVKGSIITLSDLEKEMTTSDLSAKGATDNLIRKKLEELETQERKISVTSTEVYDDIKNMATKNNMSVDEFYEAVRGSNGLNSTEFKQKIKEKLLSQKLYSSIAYTSVPQPSEQEAKEYFTLHKEEFSHPSFFDVIIYNSKDREILEKKMANPMFLSKSLLETKELLDAKKISPELVRFLSKAQVKSYTQIVPDGKDGFMLFFIKDIKTINEDNFEGVKNQVINLIMEDKREQVLSDYFARLRGNADIKIIRESKQDAK
ncbi:peptidylprolyl isomerase [Sulfurimonas sp.]|uniref:peptidylprolyl isomerase n=1 Tax=Sulfurimonas sp. TaxID=2022749 RepID=UPI0025D6E586|nr:peptidylprolyl isomerase [Sulfurimonas sp.]MDD5157804.1 peptidylprolyl isomerase [Sulfurimonas sp.]